MGYKKFLLLSTLLLGLFNTGLTKPSSTDDYNEHLQYYDDGGSNSDYDDYNENNEVNNHDVDKIENEINKYDNNQNNEVREPPKEFTIRKIINLTAYEGESIVLPCDASRSQGNIILLWYNGTDTSLITQSHTVLNQNDRIKILDNFSLEISNLTPFDSQKYYWISYPDQIKQEINLNVLEPNQLRIFSKGIDYTGKQMTLEDNQGTEFECKSFANNDNEKPILKWYYQKSNQSEQAENHVSRIIDGKIIIDHANYHHNGQYCCLGDYKERNSNLPMVCIAVRVNYSPKLSTHRHHINTKNGETAELYCDHMAQPEATIKWYKIYIDEATNHKKVKQIVQDYAKYEIKNEMHHEHNKKNSKYETKNRTILYIKNTDEYDLAKYECEGSNDMGRNNIEYRVTNKPEKPVFENIDINGNKVTIHWLVRSIQSITSATVQFKLNNNNKWQTQSILNTRKHPEHHHHWQIRHESLFSDGNWTVQAKVENVNGMSAFSVPHEFSIIDDENENAAPEQVVVAGFGANQRSSNVSGSATNILIPPFTIGLCVLINFISSLGVLS